MFRKYPSNETLREFHAMRRRHAEALKAFSHFRREPEPLGIADPDPTRDEYDHQANLECRVQALEIAFAKILHSLAPVTPADPVKPVKPAPKPKTRKTHDASIEVVKSSR
jgi:hypothetical protein